MVELEIENADLKGFWIKKFYKITKATCIRTSHLTQSQNGFLFRTERI